MNYCITGAGLQWTVFAKRREMLSIKKIILHFINRCCLSQAKTEL